MKIIVSILYLYFSVGYTQFYECIVRVLQLVMFRLPSCLLGVSLCVCALGVATWFLLLCSYSWLTGAPVHHYLIKLLQHLKCGFLPSLHQIV